MPSVRAHRRHVPQVDGALLEIGGAEPGDFVVIVAGTPANTPGSTNTLRVHQIGSLVEPR